MMNQYYGFTGRNGRSGYDADTDRSPYRRPVGRGGAYPYGASQSPRAGGCGCGGMGSPAKQGQGISLPAMNREGCGCGCGGDTACKRLMDQIRAVDFALYETVLYLDVYPNSCDALETYHKLRAQHEALHKEYEAACGPLTAFGNQSKASWDWMSKPCPWEYDAD